MNLVRPTTGVINDFSFGESRGGGGGVPFTVNCLVLTKLNLRFEPEVVR